MRSKKFAADAIDWQKTGRDFIFVLIAAGLTFASDVFIPALRSLGRPGVTLVLVPIISSLIAFAWRFVRGRGRTR